MSDSDALMLGTRRHTSSSRGQHRHRKGNISALLDRLDSVVVVGAIKDPLAARHGEWTGMARTHTWTGMARRGEITRVVPKVGFAVAMVPPHCRPHGWVIPVLRQWDHRKGHTHHRRLLETTHRPSIKGMAVARLGGVEAMPLQGQHPPGVAMVVVAVAIMAGGAATAESPLHLHVGTGV